MRIVLSEQSGGHLSQTLTFHFHPLMKKGEVVRRPYRPLPTSPSKPRLWGNRQITMRPV